MAETKAGLRDVLLVIGGGVLGGIASVIDGWDVIGSANHAIASMLLELLIKPALLGGIASLLGVFLFAAATPDSRIKMFVFALACGLAFPTWIQKAGSLSQDARNKVVAEEAAQLVPNIKENVKNADGSGQNVEVAKANVAQLNKLEALASGTTRSDIFQAKSTILGDLSRSKIGNDAQGLSLKAQLDSPAFQQQRAAAMAISAPPPPG